MNLGRRAVAIWLALVTGGCARPTAPRATLLDLGRAQAHWPAVTQADLDQGRALLLRACGDCHLPPQPRSQPVDAWPGHLDDMAVRAGLTPASRLLLERYLMTMADPAVWAGCDRENQGGDCPQRH